MNAAVAYISGGLFSLLMLDLFRQKKEEIGQQQLLVAPTPLLLFNMLYIIIIHVDVCMYVQLCREEREPRDFLRLS